MKPATVVSNGQTEETVIRKRLVPDPAGARTTPEFWEYVEALKTSDWDRHLLYINRYNGDSANGPTVPLEKCTGFLALPDGQQVPVSDREAFEYAIGQKYGGRVFRLILKRGSERVTETRIYIDAPPKMFLPPMADGGPTVTTMGDGTSDVAHHALTVMANQEKTGFEVAGAALRTSADVLARFSQAPQPGASSELDQMFKALMVKMLERMMAPPPDPLELLTKLLTLQNTVVGGGGTSGAGNPNLQKVLDVAVEKLLNPAPSGPVSSAGAELVRQLPMVAQQVTAAISEWRLGTEAQRDTAALMAGRGIPPGATVAAGRPGQILQPPANLPAASAPNPARVEGAAVGAPSFEFVESRVLHIMSVSATVDEAAERVFEFLEAIDSEAVKQLVGLGEGGLLNFFSTRPILKPATQNVPKLQEFVRAFLKYASEGDGETTGAGIKPN